MVSKKVSEFYNPTNDTWGLPQTYKDVNFYPIKINALRSQSMLHLLFGYSTQELLDFAVDIRQQKQLYKCSYLKKLYITLGSKLYKEKKMSLTRCLEMFIKDITKSNQVVCGVFDDNFVAQQPSIDELLNDDKYRILMLISNSIRDTNKKQHNTKADDKDTEEENSLVILDENDFDIIREIVLSQNGVSLSYIEEYNAELEKILMSELDNKKDKIKTFEEDMFTFASLLNVTINEIKDYTLFQYKKHYQRLSIKEDYEVLYPLVASGKLKISNGVLRFDSHVPEKGRYDSILISMKDFKNTDTYKVLE